MITNLQVFENWLTNFCFFLLLVTTIYYWIKTIFYPASSYKKIGFVGLILANIIIALQLTLRWFESGHFPLSNLYESLLFLAWGILFFYLIVESLTKNSVVGVFVLPAILCLISFTSFSLPTELQQTHPLVPALHSNWLFMHVSVMILSYASLLLGCLLSISYLVLIFFTNIRLFNSRTLDKNAYFSLFFNTKKIKTDTISVNMEEKSNNEMLMVNISSSFEPLTQRVIDSNSLPTTLTRDNNFQPFLELLDNYSYRTLSLGFCFLTLGILSGAVWANETWGSYWSWDPKETWALITWLTFAVYLHTRLIYGWSGVKSAQIATIGFFVIWICYLGVNLLGKGLHSYGFLTI